MEQVLEAINRSRGVLGSAIFSDDGSTRLINFRDNVDADAVGTLAAAICSSGAAVLSAAGRGPLFRATLEATEGWLIIYGLEGGFLVVLASRDANIGMLRLSVERAVAQSGSVDAAA